MWESFRAYLILLVIGAVIVGGFFVVTSQGTPCEQSLEACERDRIRGLGDDAYQQYLEERDERTR
jgi:hypothetical protein